MNTITNFIKRIFGLKSEKSVTVTVNQSSLDDIKKYHNLDGKSEIEQVIKSHYKSSDLNEITLKMNVLSDKVPIIEDKPKKKRYYKKKTSNKSNATNKKETTKTKSPEISDATNKTNGTTKRKYKPKNPKQTQTVQHKQ